jgi:hypothetical protein
VKEFGAASGWGQVRCRLIGNDDGDPMVFCFSTCVDSIRTIPVLNHDPDRLEDLDTRREDHAAGDRRARGGLRHGRRGDAGQRRDQIAEDLPH